MEKDAEKMDDLSNISVKEDFDLKDAQASYVERALFAYIRRYVTGGVKTLLTPPYRVFFWYILILIGLNIVMAVLLNFNIIITQQIFQAALLWSLLSALALIIGGIMGAFAKKDIYSDIFTIILLICGIGLVILSWFFPIIATTVILEWVKVGIFFIYTFYTSISMFYVLRDFQTSLYVRIITLGNSPNRLFFQPILRLGGWVVMGIGFYLATQPNPSGLILGITAFIIGWLILMLLYNIPITMDKAPVDVKEKNATAMNFRQVLGWFNLYVIYHLGTSINSSSNVGNFITEIILLAVNTFFMINGLTRKVEEIQDLTEEMAKSFRFDQKAITPMKIKKYFGMKGLVMGALGIGLGYHTILLGATTGMPNLIIMNVIGTTLNISTYYHRSVLFFCMVIVLIAIIEFNVSKGFRAEFVNRHSFRHALAMFGDLFRRKEDGSPAPVQAAIINQAEKIVHFGEKLTTDIKEKWQRSSIKGFWTRPKKDGDHPK